MQKRMLFVLALLLAALSGACRQRPSPRRSILVAKPAVAPSPAPQRPIPVVVESMVMHDDLPIFALRGVTGTEVVGVVMHGYCGHGLGVLQAFQFAAAKAGPFIALQGDRPCGNSALRAWSGDVVGTNRRIDAALSAYLGRKPPDELVLFGSSQGAVMAMDLARLYPKKYRRLILMGVFKADAANGLGQLTSAHFLVGQYENPWPARSTQRHLQAGEVQTGLLTVPNGGHSDFHGQGNPLLLQVFHDWGVARGIFLEG